MHISQLLLVKILTCNVFYSYLIRGPEVLFVANGWFYSYTDTHDGTLH